MTRRRPSPSAAALAAALVATLVVAVTLRHHALLVWVHTFDEDVYRADALHLMDHMPSALWSLDAQRGIQRLESWVLALGFWLWDGPSAFRAIRAINIVLYCSTVVPVVLWARALGVRTAVAAVAGVLAIVVPWAAVTSMFFTENVAYPAATWALYASWAVAARPSRRRVLWACLALLVALLARSVMVALPVLLAATVIVVAARFDARRAWAARATWTRRQVAPWAVFGAAVLAAVVFYAVARSSVSDQLGGSYTLDLDLRPGALWDIAKASLARVVSGLGILPAIVALAWVGRTLGRPAGRDRFALAVVAVLTFAFVVYSAQRGGPDERYLMYLAPPLLVGGAVAVDRREVGPVAVLVAGVFVVWLFSAVPWSADQHAFGFLVSGAEAFHARILLLSLGSHAPDAGLSYAAILAIGILGASALAAAALWRPGRAALAVGIALAAGVGAVQAAQLSYVVGHFQRETAWGPDLDGRAWIDRNAGAGEHVGLFITNQASATTPLPEAVREIEFWNTKLDARIFAQGVDPRSLYPGASPSRSVSIDPASGRLIAEPGAPPIPRRLVEARLIAAAPLAGRTIAEAGYEPLALVDVGPRPRVQWSIEGTDPSSWSMPGADPVIRVFRGTAGPPPAGDCLSLGLVAPDELGAQARRLTVTSGRWHTTVALRAKHPVALKAIPLTAAGPEAFAPVRLKAGGEPVRLQDGRRTRFNVSAVARVACPA